MPAERIRIDGENAEGQKGSIYLDVLNGAVGIHDADAHHVPINELFHRHTGVETTLTVATVAGQSTSITVDDPAGFAIGDPLQIQNGLIEITFPTIIGIAGSVFSLDRPIDKTFDVGTDVKQVSTNMAVDGSTTPVSFKLVSDGEEAWHIQSFLLSMLHTTPQDDATFGGLPALTKGCVLRGYNGTADAFRTFTVWKTNSDIILDMGDITYHTKAPAGFYGTSGDGQIKNRTGAVPRINSSNGDYLELLIQDDLTQLNSTIYLKGQGHIEDQ